MRSGRPFNGVRYIVKTGAQWRWMPERSFAWKSRFHRLGRDYERLAITLAGLHLVAFPCTALGRAAPLLRQAYDYL